MAIQCPDCGSDNRDIARFCEQCRKPLTLPKQSLLLPNRGRDSSLIANPPLIHIGWKPRVKAF